MASNNRGLRLRRFADRLAVNHEPGLTTTQLLLTNDDLKPVEPARRQWKAWNFVGFWIADSFNINTWMISSSMVAAGLSWWQSWLCVWIGYAIAAAFVCLTGRIGAKYHISFPVISRSSFGKAQSLPFYSLRVKKNADICVQVCGVAYGLCSIERPWPVSGMVFRPILEANVYT